MLSTRGATAENHLIMSLSAKERRRMLSSAKTVDLSQSEVLCEPGDVTRFVYFPIDGFISLLTSIAGKPVLEVGMVGREGVLGAHVALHVQAQPLHAFVQAPGVARRVPIEVFETLVASSEKLQHLMGRYVYVLMAQLATSAACTHFHRIEPRLGRWLLMMQDRSHADTFAVTHESLADLLGVRRVGVTIAAVALQKQGLIEYHRGQVTVINRRGLERAACSCYSANASVYSRMMN